MWTLAPIIHNRGRANYDFLRHFHAFLRHFTFFYGTAFFFSIVPKSIDPTKKVQKRQNCVAVLRMEAKPPTYLAASSNSPTTPATFFVIFCLSDKYRAAAENFPAHPTTDPINRARCRKQSRGAPDEHNFFSPATPQLNSGDPMQPQVTINTFPSLHQNV